jgi:hypothetical protein
MRKTKPVLVSADAPATPKRSVAITAAKAAATARASVLDDRANDAGRFPASLIVAPFNAVVLPPSIRPSQLQTAASTHGSRPPHWVAHGFHDALMTGTSQEEIREWAVRPSAKLACASAHPAGTAAARAPGLSARMPHRRVRCGSVTFPQLQFADLAACDNYCGVGARRGLGVPAREPGWSERAPPPIRGEETTSHDPSEDSHVVADVLSRALPGNRALALHRQRTRL